MTKMLLVLRNYLIFIEKAVNNDNKINTDHKIDKSSVNITNPDGQVVKTTLIGIFFKNITSLISIKKHSCANDY